MDVFTLSTPLRAVHVNWPLVRLVGFSCCPLSGPEETISPPAVGKMITYGIHVPPLIAPRPQDTQTGRGCSNILSEGDFGEIVLLSAVRDIIEKVVAKSKKHHSKKREGGI